MRRICCCVLSCALCVTYGAIAGSPSSVVGVVRDATSDVPVAGAELVLTERSGRAMVGVNTPLIYHATSGGDGRFSFENVAEGQYLLCGYARSHLDNCAWGAPKAVQVIAGSEQANVGVSLSRGVRVTVVLHDDYGILGVPGRAGRRVAGVSFVDRNGRKRVLPLTSGEERRYVFSDLLPVDLQARLEVAGAGLLVRENDGPATAAFSHLVQPGDKSTYTVVLAALPQ